MRKRSKWLFFVFRAVSIPFLAIVFLANPVPALEHDGGEGAALVVAPEQQDSCAAALRLLEEQNKKFSHELRQIKRDIAVLNRNLEEPGLREAVAGIGYIVGLLGIAAFFMARRKTDADKEGK